MLKIKESPDKKSDFLKDPAKRRFFLGPVLVVLFILLLSYLVVMPKLTDVISGQKAISSEKQRLARLTRKLTSLEGLSEYELSRKTERIMKVVPAERDLPGFLSAIRFLVESTGLDLEEIGARPGVISGPEDSNKPGDEILPSLTFVVTVSGSQEELEEFLRKTKTTLPLMRPGDINVVGQEGFYLAKLDLSVFYLPFPSALGSMESQLPEITPEEAKIYQSLSHFEAPAVPAEREIFVSAPVRVGKENPFSF